MGRRGCQDVGAMQMQPGEWADWNGTAGTGDNITRGGSCACIRRACSLPLRLGGNRAQKAGGNGRQGPGTHTVECEVWARAVPALGSSRTCTWGYLARNPAWTWAPPSSPNGPCTLPRCRRYRANPGHGTQAGCPVRQYLRIHVPSGPAVPRSTPIHVSLGWAGLAIDGKERSWSIACVGHFRAHCPPRLPPSSTSCWAGAPGEEGPSQPAREERRSARLPGQVNSTQRCSPRRNILTRVTSSAITSSPLLPSLIKAR